MTPITMRLPGMTGRRCARIVSALLRDLPGVEMVQADPATGVLVVHGSVTAEQVALALTEVVGHPSRGWPPAADGGPRGGGDVAGNPAAP